MKIGILTFFRNPNYGAMLQAYALWKFLQKEGHDVEFIDYDFPNARRISLWRCFVSRSVLGVRKKLANYVRFPITVFAESFPKTRLYVSYEDLLKNCPHYDAIVVGSDQMWNPIWCARWAVPLVFLAFAPEGCRRISYAPSFCAKEWKYPHSNEVGELLAKFSAVSVREESGREIVSSLSNRDAEVVLDPTLLHDVNFYMTSILGGMELDLSKGDGYIFHYVLEEWTDGITEKKCLDAVKHALGIERVLTDKAGVVGALQPICDGLGVTSRISLVQWLKRIAMANFVVTNSFHGTVFSILMRKPFLVVTLNGHMAGMNERIFTLLGRCGLSNRHVCAKGIALVNDVVMTPIDWGRVIQKVSEQRVGSIEYLRNALR